MSKKNQSKSGSKKKRTPKPNSCKTCNISSAERYVCCFTAYYDPTKSSGGQNAFIVRATALVTDLLEDKVVARKEAFFNPDYGDNLDTLDGFTDKAVELCAKYGAEMQMGSNPEPLEPCQRCDCGGYLDSFISKNDYLAMRQDRRRVAN